MTGGHRRVRSPPRKTAQTAPPRFSARPFRAHLETPSALVPTTRRTWPKAIVRPGSTMPDVPVIFTKPWTSLLGHDAVVDIAGQPSVKVDWEAEIAVVVGLPGKNIAAADALDHVYGYCLADDISARDLQLAGGAFSQWFKGKSLDGFCPLGPWIVRRDDIVDADAIDMLLTVNGVTKQQFVSRDMYFKVDVIIEYLSQGMELLPGDVILTGTSSGVGLYRNPPEFLREGDVVEISSSALGLLRTYIGEPRGSVEAGGVATRDYASATTTK